MQSSFFITIAVFALVAPFFVAGEGDMDNEIDGSSLNLGRAYSRPVQKCVSTSDCKKNECSVMGMQRFSEPGCEPLGGIGATCRMGQEVGESKSLSFPHMTLECENVFLLYCPCAEGLSCQEGTCQPLPERLSQESKPNGFPWTYARLH